MRKFFLMIMLSAIATITYAQQVSGKVSDGSGMAMAGVMVTINGTANLGTITDGEGNWQLDNISSDNVLLFEFMGYKSQEIQVGTQSVINVTLQEDALEMNEVVVVGYGTQRKALVSGANANVKGDAIEELKPSTAMEALQGVVPGLNITRNNGSPGAGTKVTIRGMGTIGNSSPLYIVDGVAVGDINYLNPSDIESIDVLKDAASAAIYGSRAANGVVLVTTKKGRKPHDGSMATSVTYDGYYGIQNTYKTLPTLNAQEYMYIMDEARSNEGLATFDWQNLIVNGNGYLDRTFGEGTGQAYGNYVWGMLENGWEGTNWLEEMSYDNAPTQSHSVSITGNNKDFNYAGGVSYYDQAGVIGGDIVGAGYERITARLNSELVLYKNSEHNIVTIGENFTYTNSSTKSVSNGNIHGNDVHNALVVSPLMPVSWDNENIAAWTGGYAPTLEGISADQTNPIAMMYYRSNYNENKANTVVGNVYALIEPIKNLKFRSSFGINSWFGHSRSWAPTYKLGTKYENTTDAASMSTYQGADITWTNTLTYDFKVNTDHSFSVLVGSEMLDNVLNMNLGGSKNNTLFGDFDHAYIDNTENPTNVSDLSVWGKDWAAQGGGLMSVMSRISYNYKSKYMLDVTFRADGSSNFAEGNRWGYFPSVSAGWNFSEEEFMKEVKFVDFAKLRASWGQNGNQNISNFVYTSNIAYKQQGYYFGDDKEIPSLGAIPANVPNPDVSWETSEQLNIGLDARLLTSRLSVTLDWYNKKTKDWLVVAPILGTFGASAPYINGGDVKNSGFEMSIGWNDEVGDFSYGATLSGAFNSNEVTRLANAEGVINGAGSTLAQNTSFVQRVEVGMPIGYFYGYQTAGIFQNQDQVDAYVNSEGKSIIIESEADTPRQPGDVIFVDRNDDGVINEEDKTMIGDPNPDFEYGIQLNAAYKGFFFNTTMTGKLGQQVMQSYRSFSDRPSENYTTQVFDRWHGEGTSNTMPRLTYTPTANNTLMSDIYVHDADYLRISSLTLGYDFSSLLKANKYIKGASVYFTVNNLHTFTSYDGMDPEVGYGGDTSWGSGIDLGLYPLPRTMLMGVNLTF